MGKKPIVSAQLTLLKMCVMSLLCSPRVDLWPFYGFYVNGFLSYKTRGLHRRDVTHILSKVSCFYLNPFIFVGYRNDRFFPHSNPYTSNVTQQRQCSYFELGLACSKRSDSGERCGVEKAMKSRGGLGREVREPLSPLLLPRFYFFALPFTLHRSPLSERLEQAKLGLVSVPS